MRVFSDCCGGKATIDSEGFLYRGEGVRSNCGLSLFKVIYMRLRFAVSR